MSDSTERFFIGTVIAILMLVFFISNTSYHSKTQALLTTYRNSVNALIAENKKLHAAQTMYSDAIVFSMGVKPTDFKEIRQRYEDASRWAAIETNKKFMTLQEIEHDE